MLEEEILEIYVDGSVTSQAGGVAVTTREISSNGEEILNDLLAAQFINAKSGQLEIVACSYALKEVEHRMMLRGKRKVIIFTDSKYVAENYEEAKFHWVGNSWFMKSGRPAPDAREWSELIKQLRYFYSMLKIDVRIKWIKGHSQNKQNNAVDVVAKDIARQPTFRYPKANTVLSPKQSRKFTRTKGLLRGLVRMDGQRMSIKVLECNYLRKGIWSYKYSVELNRGASWLVSDDKLFSRHSLEIGKIYSVRVGSNDNNPWIEEVY